MTAPHSPAEVEAAARQLWRDEHGSINSPDHLRTPESDEHERDETGFGAWDGGHVAEPVKGGYRQRARSALAAARDARPAQVPDGLTADVTPDGAWFVADANGLAWATPREGDETTARMIADAVNAYRRPEPTPGGERPDLEAPGAVARLLADEIADDVESAVRSARNDVRCLDCDLRYGERQNHGCGEDGRGHDRGFPESMLAEAEQEARAEVREYVTLSVADLRAAIEQDARAHRADDSRDKALREVAALRTHNGTPVTAENLRWAATHEALCRSWIGDVLMGIAGILDDRETTGADDA